MQFSDHFSAHADAYARSRPHYPGALFAWLAEQAPATEACWDAGCGNGQASIALAEHFATVFASDPSAAQIAAAPVHPRVHYLVEAAEQPSLPVHSVDLVCVAQAYHWLDHARFGAAVDRVLRPRGVVAVWCYGLCSVDAEVDRHFEYLYDEVLGADWPAERVHVEQGYRNLPFVWQEIEPLPEFAMLMAWSCREYLAYLQTWSAYQRHLQRTGNDPLASLRVRFEAAWGDPEVRRTVAFPLKLRVGRKPGMPATG